MTLVDQIKTAPSPRAAMLVLAEAIDAINARLDSQPADPWAHWSDEADEVYDGPPLTIEEAREAQRKINAARAVELDFKHNQREAAIDAVKEQLKTAVGDDATALQAKLRLLKDTEANVMQPAVDEGDRAAIDSDGTTGTVDIPPPTQERMDARGAWAIEHKLWEFIPLDEYDAVDAFSKGGTAWLYYANREAIMQMPFDWRLWLVEDIAVDSPAEAQEVGRDLLKSQQSADRDITVQAVQAMGDARG